MKSFKLLSAILALSCALQVSQCFGSDLVGVCEPLTKSERETLNYSLKVAGQVGKIVTLVVVFGVVRKAADLTQEYNTYLNRIRQATRKDPLSSEKQQEIEAILRGLSA